jgi:hypothetical protein
MIRLLTGVALGAALGLWFGLWWDERYVRTFIAREQMTVRPVPRYRRRCAPAQS